MKKTIVLLMSVAIVGGALSAPVTVEASTLNANECQYNFASHSNVIKAIVIKKKYRVHQGKRQYRRWNETEGVWVDPDWIDM